MTEWVMLGRVEIPFTAEEGEANAKSKQMAAELEDKIGVRVGVTTVRKWFWEAATRKPDPPPLPVYRASEPEHRGTVKRSMGRGPQQ